MTRLVLIVASVMALALASGASAAPPPNCCDDPFNQFVITRVLPNGNEVKLGLYSLEAGYTTDQVVRREVYVFACSQRLNNPAWVVVVYGPIDPPATFYTDGDRIWDSRYNYEPSLCTG